MKHVHDVQLTNDLDLHAIEPSSFRNRPFSSSHLKVQTFQSLLAEVIHPKHQIDPNHTPELHYVYPPRIQPPRGPRAAAAYVLSPSNTVPTNTHSKP